VDAVSGVREKDVTRLRLWRHRLREVQPGDSFPLRGDAVFAVREKDVTGLRLWRHQEV